MLIFDTVTVIKVLLLLIQAVCQVVRSTVWFSRALCHYMCSRNIFVAAVCSTGYVCVLCVT